MVATSIASSWRFLFGNSEADGKSASAFEIRGPESHNSMSVDRIPVKDPRGAPGVPERDALTKQEIFRIQGTAKWLDRDSVRRTSRST